MVRIEVLAVGRELLIGRTVNTNAHWIGRRLALMGTMITRMTTADDNLEEISSSLKEMLGHRPDFIIVAGGLGPTPDDMTLEGIAKGLGRRLRVNQEGLRLIRAHLLKIGRTDVEITPAQRKMATLPVGGTPLPNEMGTAPGVRIEVGQTTVFCLPGVPKEMKSIFTGSIEEEVRTKVGRLYRKAIRLKFEGIYESNLAPLIRKAMDQYPGVYIKSHPRGLRDGVSRIELDIVAVKQTREGAHMTAESIANKLIREVKERGAVVEYLLGMPTTEGKNRER